MYGYVSLSILTGARTEELRALRWSDVDLTGDPEAQPPVPPTVQLWRSVRSGGDTKTRLSRRTLRLPERCVEALVRHRDSQAREKVGAGASWVDLQLVFCTRYGTPLDAANVRRAFRAVAKEAGLDPTEWTPRELRHTFASLLSDAGVPVEEIARLVGHRGTVVTEAVYRKQLRPVITQGAETMDRLFAHEDSDHEKGQAPDAGP